MHLPSVSRYFFLYMSIKTQILTHILRYKFCLNNLINYNFTTSTYISTKLLTVIAIAIVGKLINLLMFIQVYVIYKAFLQLHKDYIIKQRNKIYLL